MKWIRKLHLYAGIVLALPMFVYALTGGALLFKDEMQRSRIPALDEPVKVGSAEEFAYAFSQAVAHFPDDTVRMIRTPRAGAALYHIYLATGEAYVSQTGDRVVARWAWHENAAGVLSEIHFHLAMGRSGRLLSGVLAIALAVMVATGLVIFWPFRKRFAVNSLILRSSSRLAWSRLHRDLGLLAMPLILMFAVTAAGVIFPDAARGVIAGLTGAVGQNSERPRVQTQSVVGTASAAEIARAVAVFPGAKLMSYSPPVAGDAVHYLRFRQDKEPHPYGRTAVYIDGTTGEIIQTEDALLASRSERAVNWLYPLHAVRVGGLPYLLLALLAALALAAMAVSGPLIYLKGQRRWRRPPA